MTVPRQDLTKLKPVFGWCFSVSGGFHDPVMRCTNGHISSLREHTIKPDGSVTPSVQCPKCGFHENVVLEKYVPPSATVPEAIIEHDEKEFKWDRRS